MLQPVCSCTAMEGNVKLLCQVNLIWAPSTLLVRFTTVGINIEADNKLFIRHDSALFAWLIICQMICLNKYLALSRYEHVVIIS